MLDSAWVRPSVAIPPAVFLGFGFVASINLSNVNVPMTNTAPSNGCVRNFDASYCSFTIHTESKIGLPRSASRPIISKILSNKNRSWSIYIYIYLSIHMNVCMYMYVHVHIHTYRYIQVYIDVFMYVYMYVCEASNVCTVCTHTWHTFMIYVHYQKSKN